MKSVRLGLGITVVPSVVGILHHGASALFMTYIAILQAMEAFQLAFSGLFAGGLILLEREAFPDFVQSPCRLSLV
jgi:hypothetical protein